MKCRKSYQMLRMMHFSLLQIDLRVWRLLVRELETLSTQAHFLSLFHSVSPRSICYWYCHHLRHRYRSSMTCRNEILVLRCGPGVTSDVLHLLLPKKKNVVQKLGVSTAFFARRWLAVFATHNIASKCWSFQCSFYRFEPCLHRLPLQEERRRCLLSSARSMPPGFVFFTLLD